MICENNFHCEPLHPVQNTPTDGKVHRMRYVQCQETLRLMQKIRSDHILAQMHQDFVYRQKVIITKREINSLII